MADVFREEKDEGSLEVRLSNIESQISSLNPRNYAGIRQKELRALTRANLFGDGSDGEYVLDGTQAAVANLFSKSGNDYTLLRDAYFSQITVKNGITLKTDHYRLMVSGDVIVAAGGTIQNIGAAGAAGGNGSGETAGTGASGASAVSGNSLPGIVATAGGGNGGGGEPTTTPAGNGVSGTAGTAADKGLGAAGAGGGAGGSTDPGPNGLGGSGGNGGSITGTVYNIPRTPVSAFYLFDYNPSFQAFALSASGGGGGGGGGGSAGAGTAGGGGGGGAAGGGGGAISIFANRIINDGTITVAGGAGGAGGNGGNAGGAGDNEGGAGGGGGAGGTGGVIILVYGIRTGSGTFPVTGGAGGAGGTQGTSTGSGTSQDGTAGTTGTSGVFIDIEVK